MGRFSGRGNAGHKQHFPAQFGDERNQIRRTISAKGINGFPDFDGISDGIAQRLLHTGDQRHHPPAGVLPDVHHGFGKRQGVLIFLHKCALAGFNI